MNLISKPLLGTMLDHDITTLKTSLLQSSAGESSCIHGSLSARLGLKTTTADILIYN